MASGVLYPYSIGIVAKDKEPKDKFTIEVFPLEKLPSGGEDPVEEETLSGDYKNTYDETFNFELKKANTVTATWLANGDFNRESAPDVCAGHYVMLYRYTGEDAYYWTTLFTEADLKKKETVMYFYSNKAKPMPTEEDRENLNKRGYFMLIDTRNQFVKFHTDKDEDSETPEKAGYDFSLNTKEGKLEFKDTEENILTVDSVEGHMELTMQGDMKITLPNDEDDKGNFTMDIKGNHTTTIAKKAEMSVEETLDITTKDTTTLTVDKKLVGKISDNVEFEFKKIKLSNGSDELISLLIDLVQEIMDMQHLGNQGAPTQIHPSSMPKFIKLKTKLQQFKV